MRNLTLQSLLQDFATDAGMRLTLAASSGDEIPFEVVPSAARSANRIPLYCYRPLTTEFIRRRLGLLAALPTYTPAARALEAVGGTDAYLRARGELMVPDSPRELAHAALRLFLWRVFEDRSEFEFDDARFELAYEELERAIYQGRCVTEIVAPLLGLDLDRDTDELALGDGLSLMRPRALTAAPAEFVNLEQPPLLLVLRVAHERLQHPSMGFARSRFRRVLTALRLYEHGGYAVGQSGYSRIDDGAWVPAALGSGGRPRLLTLIAAGSEDELRGFCNLISRRLPGAAGSRLDTSGAGELSWALARFEMGAERGAAYEGLTDYLLALRALLEPEGPTSGRLAQRLSVICAPPEERSELAERVARAIALEHSVIAGLATVEPSLDELVDEVAEHLRAILRDLICGHLDSDVCAIADESLVKQQPPRLLRKLKPVYHVDLRSGVHAARAFNLSAEDLERRFVAPMRAGRPFNYEDRDWEPRDTQMVVFEAEHLRPDQIGMGRGWATVEKKGQDVTAEVFKRAPAAAAASEPASLDPLRQRLIGRLAAGPVTLPEIIELAAGLTPDGNMQEHAEASAQAIWELLRSGSAQLSASDR